MKRFLNQNLRLKKLHVKEYSDHIECYSAIRI